MTNEIAVPDTSPSRRWTPPAFAAAVILALTVVQLHLQGRRWWCECGGWSPWSSDAYGRHNSQHFLDPYSITHASHGLIFCGLLALVAGRWLDIRWRFVVAILLECAWEVLENSQAVINRYRAATVSIGYVGDSIVNSIGDVVSCGFGFWLANRLGFRISLALFVASEVLLLFWIRDGLVLNVVMLIHPFDAVLAWQKGQ